MHMKKKRLKTPISQKQKLNLHQKLKEKVVYQHIYTFRITIPVGPLTQVDSQIHENQDMQAEDIAILTERYDDAYTNGDQEEMLTIQDQIDWWTTVL